MFKIYDGRSQFYQWDIDRKVVVNDNSINQVHFCNRTDDCSLICEVYDLDGLRVADVPNILLQDNWRINVYAYDHNYTKHCDVFEVVKRSKPADYVYTETEILNFDTIMERLDGIEEDIGEEVQKYLEENDIDIDLTGYATETYVNEAVAAIELMPGPAGAPGKDGKDGVDGAPGEPGKDGAPGKDGVDGYTPIKGVDYFDGKDGAPGKDGKDGVDGEPGKDYVLTDADKEEIAGMVNVEGGSSGYHFKKDVELTESEMAIINALSTNPTLEVPITINGESVISISGKTNTCLVRFIVMKYNSAYSTLNKYIFKDYVVQNGTTKIIDDPNGDMAVIEASEVMFETSDVPAGMMGGANNLRLNRVMNYISTNAAWKSDLSDYQTATQVAAAITDALGAIGVAEEGEY